MAESIPAVPLPPINFFSESTSDDEESFVVLGSSLPATPLSETDTYVSQAAEATSSLDASAVETALNLVQTHLSNMSGSTSSFPSLPKVSEHDLVTLVDKLNIGTTTTNSSVDLGPDEIQQKVDLLVEENLKLKETLHQNNLAMKNQYATLVLWQEDVMKVHQSHKEKFAETKKYIENLKIENAKLTQLLALEQSKCTTSSVEAAASTNDFMSTNLIEFELEAAQKKILALETELKLLQTEKLTWEKTCSIQKSVTDQTENFQNELEGCKQLHAQELAGYIKQIQQYDSLQKILLDEIKMLKTKGDHSKCITQEALDNVQEQLMAAQMHITKLELLRNQDKEIINEKESEITKLKAKIEEDKDVIFALDEQLKLYKTDFEMEHQLRNNLNIEKEQIATDLQQLQRRNNQLLEEVERLRGGDFVHVERLEQAAVASGPSAPQDSPPLSSYFCPICMNRFRSLRLVEEHAEYCLNNAS